MISQKRYQSSAEIRDMRAGDLAEIMKIEKRSFPTPWSESMFRKELRVDFSRNLVAMTTDEGSRIIGYMNYWVFADEVHLNNVAVRMDFRRKGIASKLMSEMVKRSRAEGALWGTLEVRRSNRAAIALYERYGYVVKGVRPNYYNDTKEDALILWCGLKEAEERISSVDSS